MQVLLEVRNLVKYFPVTKGFIFDKKVGDVKAVDGVSFWIEKGKTLGLVGESGCGKTTTAKCVLQLIRSTSGDILFDGVDLNTLKGTSRRHMYRRIQAVFQDPNSSLNPRHTVRQIIGEPAIVHGVAKGRELRSMIEENLKLVGLDPGAAEFYPHMFSGGQRQRIAIARALILRPSFIVCDEPVSALDVSIQAQIINLFMELQERLGVTYLFIAHDLSVVRHISDWVAVMYLGKIMEMAPADEICTSPLHCYSQALVSAVPIPNPKVEAGRQRILLEGDVPSPVNPPSGCRFHPRCWKTKSNCREIEPPLKDLGKHWVACHNL